MKVWLLIEEIELCAESLLAWYKIGQSLSLETWGKSLVVQLKLSIENIEGVPALGEG